MALNGLFGLGLAGSLSRPNPYAAFGPARLGLAEVLAASPATKLERAKWGNYSFTVYNYYRNWDSGAGVYIFAGMDLVGEWRALYVGSAESLATRIPNHERWQEAWRLGATHVHARLEPHGLGRAMVEDQLIKEFQPPLNVQGK